MRYFLVMVAVIVATVVAATGALGGSISDAAAAKPKLAVVVVGVGRVTSTPAGISCPGRCVATFRAGSRVLLTQKARTGSRFLRWGGSCTGAGSCRVRVSASSTVTARFVAQRSLAEPGNYSGVVSQQGQPSTMTFSVLAGGSSVVNIAVRDVYLRGCTPPGNFPKYEPFGVLKTAIKPDGSFTATTSQNGVFAGVKAKFTYSINGRFQKATAGGAATASGSFREDIVFADSTTHTCTSNDQSWTATRTRDPQPPQTPVIVPGNYSGVVSQQGQPSTMTFSVLAGGSSVVNIAVRDVYLRGCTPPGSFPKYAPFAVLKTAIKPDGSFTATTSQDGVFAGVKAKFMYSIHGYFQGVNAAGAAAASGFFREDVVFADSTTRTCTSNDQFWTASRSG